MKYTTLLGRSKPVILSNEQVNNIINGVQVAFIIPITNKDVYKVNDFLYVKEPAYMNNDKNILFLNNLSEIDLSIYKPLNAKQLNKTQSRLFLRVTSSKYTSFDSINDSDLQNLGCNNKELLYKLWQDTIDTYKETYSKPLSDKFINNNQIKNNPGIQICAIEVIIPEND